MYAKELALRLYSDGEISTSFTGVCIDSRLVAPGNLFIAIRGDKFDGHDYIQEAISNGAKGIVCSKLVDNLSVSYWLVADTILFLAELAREFRNLQVNCPVIAVTGSNGKTSVKEMIHAILPSPSFATPGNLNNHIGVPLSVLQLQTQHKYAVFELGANHEGEIRYTASIVQPDVAVITTIAPAHLEGFGDLAGVIRAKNEIYQALLPGKIAIINEDDKKTNALKKALVQQKIIGFSMHNPTTIHAKNLHLNSEGCGVFQLVTPDGESNVILRVPGLHNVSNALAAAACTYAVGISLENIVLGLTSFSGVEGRLTFRKGRYQSLIIDDTYNANLRSVLSALDVLSERDGVRVLVLGDMGELGEKTLEHHHDLGIAAREKGIQQLFTCGRHSLETARAFGENAQHYEDQAELISALMPQLNAQTTVLVKGSRQSAMENIVKQLIE